MYRVHALITSNIALTYKVKMDYLNASKAFFQVAKMYQTLGLMEKSEKNIKEIQEMYPKIDIQNRELLKYEIKRLLKRTSDTLSKNFTYIFISCPNCGFEHQIQASAITVADELCSICGVNFSVFYSEDSNEFYTNIY
ncbi:MAG: hypothetical protein ACFFAS_07305 [Promethearchaeota archaeon]